ncbi:MAG TPA: glycosyltransferase [Candidatus Angelobacter sp.]
MDRPDVSLVIPVFEQHVFLPLVFESLRRQDFSGRVEILVCDDGSQADHRALVEREARRGTNIRYIWQPHCGRGVARSRNNGVRCAQGDLLIFLDGDSLAPPDFISTHVSAHGSEKVLFCGSRKQVFMESKDIFPWQAMPTEEVMQKMEGLPHRSMRAWQEEIYPRAPWRICMGCNASVRRAGCVAFDEDLTGWGCEDVEFGCRLYSRENYTIAIDPLSFVYSIEFGDEAGFSRVRPKSHEDIILCLKDLLRVRGSYPEIDTSPLLLMAQYFAIDPVTNQWRQLPEAVAQQRNTDEAIQQAMAWLQLHGSLP